MRTLNRALLNELVGDKLPKGQLKNILGGSDDPTYDGGELPGVTITCNGNGRGRCYDFDECKWDSSYFPPIKTTTCKATGDPNHYCESGLPCYF